MGMWDLFSNKEFDTFRVVWCRMGSKSKSTARGLKNEDIIDCIRRATEGFETHDARFLWGTNTPN